MASPGTTHLRQDFLSRPSLELFSSGSLTGSIPEGFVLQQQQVDDGGIALPLGAPPEPGCVRCATASQHRTMSVQLLPATRMPTPACACRCAAAAATPPPLAACCRRQTRLPQQRPQGRG